MQYLFSVAAGAIGGATAVLLLGTRRSRRKKGQERRKIECSKLVLWAVLLSYFVGFGVGIWAVFVESKGGKRCEDQAGTPESNRGNPR